MVQERGTRDETRTNPVELASERLARAGSVTFGLVSKAIVAVPTLGSKSGAFRIWINPASCVDKRRRCLRCGRCAKCELGI